MTKLAQVFQFDLQGKRQDKYDFLNNNSLQSIGWNELNPTTPNFFFANKNFDGATDYESGFKIDELFQASNVGIVTGRDSFTLQNTQEKIDKTIKDFIKNDDETSRKIFALGDDARDWQIKLAKNDLKNNYPNNGFFTKVDYRVFDTKWTFYTGKTKGFISYPRYDVMKHFLKPNIALIAPKQAIKGFNHVFLSNKISDKNFIDSAGQFGAGNVFPLYLYPEPNSQDLFASQERKPNLNQEIVDKIGEGLGLRFVPEPITNSTAVETGHALSLPTTSLSEISATPQPNATTPNQTFSPIDILDYIYAVLHSPNYREKYKEFLKIDFPRVPYPSDTHTFWQLVKLGSELRQIHLLESPTVENYLTQYPEDGSNEVGKIKYENGKVWINESQYFANVPETAWNFYIGGYQPAQKWLKDRKDRVLGFEDILHYQKIIVALSETDRLMQEIDSFIVF